jgi:hypothetical protein
VRASPPFGCRASKSSAQAAIYTTRSQNRLKTALLRYPIAPMPDTPKRECYVSPRLRCAQTFMTASYILPLRLHSAGAIPELARYLERLAQVEIIVVDGSRQELFDRLHGLIKNFAIHVKPAMPGRNGKVRGVLTALPLASKEYIIVADDDVRYNSASLEEVLRRLVYAAVVRPQNFFSPAPWHAVWDSARSLINRALDGDWPGTLAFRRSALPRGYNADVLFENYELVRTIRAGGGRESVARDIFVARRPPTFEHFMGQRIRQAYDEFARPWRLLVGLATLPGLLVAWHAAGIAALLDYIAVAVFIAAIGWLRAGAYRYFSPLCVLAAPLWILERGICSWLALWQRIRFGGIRYGDSVIAASASSQRERQRWAT